MKDDKTILIFFSSLGTVHFPENRNLIKKASYPIYIFFSYYMVHIFFRIIIIILASEGP